MCCVHVPLPIIARLSVSKDLHLEVPHHGVHHLPRKQKEHVRRHFSLDSLLISIDQHLPLICTFCSNLADLPVDPPRPFLRFDVDIIVIDINLRNLNLEVVGKEPDGFPHRAKAGTPWRLKQRRRGRRAWREQREE